MVFCHRVTCMCLPFEVFRAFDLTVVESTLLSQDPFNVDPGYLFSAIEGLSEAE